MKYLLNTKINTSDIEQQIQSYIPNTHDRTNNCSVGRTCNKYAFDLLLYRLIINVLSSFLQLIDSNNETEEKIISSQYKFLKFTISINTTISDY